MLKTKSEYFCIALSTILKITWQALAPQLRGKTNKGFWRPWYSERRGSFLQPCPLDQLEFINFLAIVLNVLLFLAKL